MNKDNVDVGDTLYGYCNGFFAGGASEPKRIVAMGKDWVVCRTENGRPIFASFEPGWQLAQMPELLKKWSEGDC
jgi:hypothetical protein